MNERIRELARRVVGKHRNDVSSISLFDEQIEKFAELIVRECARVAKITEPDAGDEYSFGRTWAGIDVLKHFGVEE